GRALQVGGAWVAGLSWVPITPFGIKDWERWEDGGDETPVRLSGSRSGGEGVREFRFDPADRSPTIADGLAELARLSPPAGPADRPPTMPHGLGEVAGLPPRADTIYVLHPPPRDTACDVISTRQHVGSRAIRRFVESEQPPLVLSGHIHESPRVSGAWKDRVG